MVLVALEMLACADGQIRRLLESNFRPVVSPMQDLMTQQFMNMMAHRNQQGELVRLASMNNTSLAPIQAMVNSILTDPRAQPLNVIEGMFEKVKDTNTWLTNLGRRLRGDATVPLDGPARLQAMNDARILAESKMKAMQEQMALRAADSGRLFGDVNDLQRAVGGDRVDVVEFGDLTRTEGPAEPASAIPPLPPTHGFSHQAHVGADGDVWYRRIMPNMSMPNMPSRRRLPTNMSNMSFNDGMDATNLLFTLGVGAAGLGQAIAR